MQVHSQQAIDVTPSLHAAIRDAQQRWMLSSIRERLRIFKRFRSLFIDDAELLAVQAATIASRPITEKIVAEILPLADACRWLERNAGRILASRRGGWRQLPLWLWPSSFEVQRQPHGLVLVIGPGNYPLFLPAVQAIQALVAGNAVLLKPAPGTRTIAMTFARLLYRAGLDPSLLTILPEDNDVVAKVINLGVDKVVFTGGSENGRDVLAMLAPFGTPSVMELSGQDAMIVLHDAMLSMVVGAIRFGLELNQGNTCIAPRRLIVVEAVAESLSRLLSAEKIVHPPIEQVRDTEEAIARVNAGAFGLGASIFTTDHIEARMVASRLRTGFAVINDIIVPTADPRMPFGGIKASGFGCTRGREGLLEMTFAHVVAHRSGTFRPHYDVAYSDRTNFFLAYLRVAHGRGLRRLRSLGALFREGRVFTKSPKRTL